MWTYESIPTLGHMCNNLVAPHAILCCLQRKYKPPSEIDFDALFTQQLLININFYFLFDFFNIKIVAGMCWDEESHCEPC